MDRREGEKVSATDTDSDYIARTEARADFREGEAKTGMPDAYYFEYSRLYQIDANLDARTA